MCCPYKCYVLPVFAGILFVVFSLDLLRLGAYIPDRSYFVYTYMLIMITVLFVACRLLDLYYQ